MAKQVDYESIGRSARARSVASKTVIYILLTLIVIATSYYLYKDRRAGNG